MSWFDPPGADQRLRALGIGFGQLAADQVDLATARKLLADRDGCCQPMVRGGRTPGPARHPLARPDSPRAAEDEMQAQAERYGVPMNLLRVQAPGGLDEGLVMGLATLLRRAPPSVTAIAREAVQAVASGEVQPGEDLFLQGVHRLVQASGEVPLPERLVKGLAKHFAALQAPRLPSTDRRPENQEQRDALSLAISDRVLEAGLLARPECDLFAVRVGLCFGYEPRLVKDDTAIRRMKRRRNRVARRGHGGSEAD